MCYIVASGPGGAGYDFPVGKIPYKFAKGNWMQVNKGTYKLKCLHPDGRSDTYLVGPGQRIVADEEATFEILERYPDEMPTLQPQSSPPEPKSVPAELPV